MIVINQDSSLSRFQINSLSNLHFDKTDNGIYRNICEEWKLICVLTGSLTVTLGDNIYIANAGDIVFFAPGDFYCIRENKNSEYITIDFSCNNNLPSQFWGKLVQTTTLEQSLIQEICSIANDRDNSIQYNKICCLLELIILYCAESETKEPLSQDRDVEFFYKAVAILKKKLQGQISVSDLADTLNISLSHLKRVFAHYAALGVHEYFNYLKINLAKQKLSEGESVTATAEYLGFANQAYFSTAFKRITGVSPKEFSLEKVGSTPNKPKTVRKQANRKDMPDYLL